MIMLLVNIVIYDYKSGKYAYLSVSLPFGCVPIHVVYLIVLQLVLVLLRVFFTPRERPL